MLNKLSELDKFTTWLREQSQDQTYDWGDGENCLMAQYLKATGQEDAMMPMPDWYMQVTLNTPHTFSAALQRAENFRPAA